MLSSLLPLPIYSPFNSFNSRSDPFNSLIRYMCKMFQIPIPIRRGSCEMQDHQEMLQLGVVNGNKARRWKPNNVEAAPNCPRCASPNTKFCYYNNYSLSQPRYFCKSCRRYWTKGGFLRNIPVGGGSRKSRRNSSNSNTILPSHPPPPPINHNQSDSHHEASHIDMALVFSNFLSSGRQDSPIHEVSSSSNSKLCSSSTPESVESESVHASQPSDPLPLADEGLISGIDELEWERLLGDHHHHEVVQDVFWSHATTSSSLTWHQDLVDYPIPFNYDHHHIEDPHLHITDPATWTTWTSLI